MSRQGENIYLRKDGRWEGRYILRDTSGGAVKYKSVYGKTADEVRSKLQAYIDSLHKDKRTLPRCELTVAEALDMWLAVKREEVKLTSYSAYEQLIKSRLLPGFGPVPLEHLTVNAVIRYVRKIKADGLADRSIKNIIAIIKAVVKMAEQYYYLPEAEAIRRLNVSEYLKKKENLSSLRIVNNKVVDVSGNTIIYIGKSGLRVAEI